MIVLAAIGDALQRTQDAVQRTQDETALSGNASQTGAQQAVQVLNSPNELADAFDANHVAATQQWKGQYVQFTATISNITDSGILFSDVTSQAFSFTSIQCNTTNKEQLLGLRNGQMATVKGKVTGQFLTLIKLDPCQVAS